MKYFLYRTRTASKLTKGDISKQDRSCRLKISGKTGRDTSDHVGLHHHQACRDVAMGERATPLPSLKVFCSLLCFALAPSSESGLFLERRGKVSGGGGVSGRTHGVMCPATGKLPVILRSSAGVARKAGDTFPTVSRTVAL